MPRAHNRININEKDIEPSQMVFQGDARNELGPSPRGAIYRKRQAWKHLFTRSSVPSYQDWNIAENENLQQLPSPRLLALASRQKNIYKNQAARPLKNTSGGNRRAQPSLSSGGMACALTSKNNQSPKSKCSADQRKPARRARLRQPKEPLKGSARRGPSSASVAR